MSAANASEEEHELAAGASEEGLESTTVDAAEEGHAVEAAKERHTRTRR